jgi:transcriptional regulator with XRE-family HTH domain
MFAKVCLTHQACLDILSNMITNSKNNLGSYLRSLRDARGLTLRGVEDITGISNAFLSQIESGKVKQPSPVNLYKLAQLYEVSYEHLMIYAGYPMPEKTSLNAPSESNVLSRIGPLTEEEEHALLDYLAYLRSRLKRKVR